MSILGIIKYTWDSWEPLPLFNKIHCLMTDMICIKYGNGNYSKRWKKLNDKNGFYMTSVGGNKFGRYIFPTKSCHKSYFWRNRNPRRTGQLQPDLTALYYIFGITVSHFSIPTNCIRGTDTHLFHKVIENWVYEFVSEFDVAENMWMMNYLKDKLYRWKIQLKNNILISLYFTLFYLDKRHNILIGIPRLESPKIIFNV